MSLPFKKPAICNTTSGRVGTTIWRKYGIISEKLQKLITSFLLLWICKRSIEEANKEVTAILCDPAKRHPNLKISPEQKAIMARYAANLGIIKAVRQFSKDFPENSLKETTIRGWKKTYLKELSSRKKAGKDMTIEKLPEKKTGRPLMLGDTLDVCKPRKFTLHNAYC